MRKSDAVPISLDWISDEDELAKALLSTAIITRPGMTKRAQS